MEIFCKFIHATLARSTNMPLEMILNTMPSALFKPCCWNWLATPGVAICTETIVKPALGIGISLKGETLEYPGKYHIHHLSVRLQLLIQPLLWTCYTFGVTVCFWGHTKSLDDSYIDTWSEITNHHSDFYIGSTFRICSLLGHISITRPLNQLIHDNRKAKCK